MTRQDFQKTYSDQLKTFLATPCGQHFLNALVNMRPQHEFHQQNHIFAENRGAIRGYENCVRNIPILAMPFVAHQEVEPTYGVTGKSI